MSDFPENHSETRSEGKIPDYQAPIEPEKKLLARSGLLRLLIFIIVVVYLLISYLHVPLLTEMGKFLIVDQEPEKSDLIVCLAGGNIERGIATADAYKMGLAPYVFIARERLPDGYELLEARGIEYPETVDLMIMLLESLGVPEQAILTSGDRAVSTFNEAEIVKDLAVDKNFKSIIVLTSPTHTRRARLTYKEVFRDTGVRISMKASVYSGFNPEAWWKDRKYIKDVIIEYQKLIFYKIQFLL